MGQTFVLCYTTISQPLRLGSDDVDRRKGRRGHWEGPGPSKRPGSARAGHATWRRVPASTGLSLLS